MVCKVDKYLVGGKGFSTKKEILSYCKTILNSNFGSLVGEDLLFVDDVFKMHPRYIEKSGGGSYEIFIGNNIENTKYNAFYIRLQTGETIDFSYMKAVNGYSMETKIKETLRDIIRSQTTSYRRCYIKRKGLPSGHIICEDTGLKIRPEEAHLDHYPLQFEEIVLMWMKENNLTISDIKLTPPKGMGTRWVFEDTSLEESFYDFHNKVAKYRVVLNKVNLQRSKAKVKLPV